MKIFFNQTVTIEKKLEMSLDLNDFESIKDFEILTGQNKVSNEEYNKVFLKYKLNSSVSSTEESTPEFSSIKIELIENELPLILKRINEEK